MSRRQKLVLAILGLADFLVILAMGLYVFRHTRPTPPPASPAEQPVLSACANHLLDSLATTGGSATLSWDESTAFVHIAFPETDLREEDAAQMLWVVLASMPRQTADVCPLPQTVHIQASIPDPRGTHRHAMELSGAVLNDWLTEEIDDAELAAQCRYRNLSELTP